MVSISPLAVGTGMSARVMERLRTRLGPHMLPATRGARRGAPLAYATTGAAGETPDVWIDSPENSVVLTVNADVRLVKTATFASDFSLRFPRVTCVRWDKPWHECLSDAELERRAREDGGIAVARAENLGEVTFRFGSKRKNRSTRDERDERDERAYDAQKSLPAHLALAETPLIDRMMSPSWILDAAAGERGSMSVTTSASSSKPSAMPRDMPGARTIVV